MESTDAFDRGNGDANDKLRQELAATRNAFDAKVAELERSQRMLLGSLNAARMIAFEVDLRTGVVERQGAWCETLDVETRGEMVSFEKRIYPQDRDEFLAASKACTSDHAHYTVTYRFDIGDETFQWLRDDGEVLYDASGQAERIIGTCRDVTQKRKAEIEAAATSERRLQRVIDGSSIGIAFATSSGNVVNANDAALRMLGISRAKFAKHGFRWTSAIRATDMERAREVVEDLQRTGRMPPIELQLRHSGGELRPVMVSSLSVNSETGNPDDEHVVFLVDISEQKRYEASLEEARQLAERANESKSEFLANMSHEIRTPMSAIVGYLDILSRNLTQADDLKCISIIRNNSRFLLEIINDILDVSKIEAGKLTLQKKRFQPVRLISDVRSLMQVRAAEKDIKLSIEFGSELPRTIRSDDKRLKQVLVNLIGNAIKFTESGSVTLRVTLNAADQKLEFHVIDTGIGVNPKLLAKLFQPFVQGDTSLNREFGGTGLGLTISQRLAKLLGGEITAESQTGVGSQFSLTIATGSLKNVPLIKPNLAQAPVAEKPSAEDEIPVLGGRALVVDDRRDIRFIANTTLQDAGMLVEEAENGAEAIEAMCRARANESPFDVVIMDMQMPVMDGYEATRQLRKMDFKQPIVALTAHAMKGDRERCLDAGCSDYLTKPLDKQKFLSLLAETLYDSTAVTPAPTAMPQTTAPSNTKRVLVVDDSLEAAEALKTLLELDDHQVEIATTGASAIEIIPKFQPDLVLLDLGLPDMSGFDVFRSAKTADTTNKRIYVALTGQCNQDETAAAGFDHHIVKPADIAELESLVANL